MIAIDPRRALTSAGLGLLALLATACGDDGSPGQPRPDARPDENPDARVPAGLHVPSPEWQDQIIYFVMTDRFADGEPGNNDQGAGEHDPADGAKYSGGDLQGVIDQLDYVQELGATAVWITPPVANQWWDPFVNYGGYHGYWAQDFKSVDPHLGTLDTYKALSIALHERGMYLVQDIVTNHTGNFFTYEDVNGVNRRWPRSKPPGSARRSLPRHGPHSCAAASLPANRVSELPYSKPVIEGSLQFQCAHAACDGKNIGTAHGNLHTVYTPRVPDNAVLVAVHSTCEHVSDRASGRGPLHDHSLTCQRLDEIIGYPTDDASSLRAHIHGITPADRPIRNGQAVDLHVAVESHNLVASRNRRV